MDLSAWILFIPVAIALGFVLTLAARAPHRTRTDRLIVAASIAGALYTIVTAFNGSSFGPLAAVGLTVGFVLVGALVWIAAVRLVDRRRQAPGSEAAPGAQGPSTD